MDALFSRFGSASAPRSNQQGVFPAVNLYETPDAYMLTGELPGVERDAIHVSIQGSTVTLSGERKIDYAGRKDVSLHRRERQDGNFQRAFQLPATIDAEKIEAVHRNGVLTLRLPKKPETQPRQISVQAG